MFNIDAIIANYVLIFILYRYTGDRRSKDFGSFIDHITFSLR